MMQPIVKAFFDENTFTITYVVSAPGDGHGVIIDSVLDFDAKSGCTKTTAADAVLAYVKATGLSIDWILETHVHADHLTAAPYLKERLGAKVAISDRITEVQKTFAALFNYGPSMATDGRQFDRLLRDGDRLQAGALTIDVWQTPGHTPACAMFLIGDAVFVGDTIFMPDFGTARCDFPGGDARALYHSLRRLLALPEATRLFICHDYGPGGRAYAWETTVGTQRAENIHIKDGVDEQSYVAMRTARDAQLSMPALLLPSVQINMAAGQLPPPEANGTVYLKLPINAF